MTALMKRNFIDEYTKRVMEYTDAPEVFIRASAYYIVSATLGEFYINKLVPFGSQRPNLWIMLSSIPGRMRRSTVQGLAYNAFKKVIGEEADRIVIEEGTPEGILDVIGEEPNSSYTVQSTEWGAVLQRMRHAQYQVGVSSLLSKLYYGEGGRQSLSQRGGKSKGRMLPKGLYVTLLVGLQEPQYYFSTGMLYQGLLRRLLVVYVDKAERWKKPIDVLRQKFQMHDLVEILSNERKQLLQNINKVSVMLLPDAEEKINAFSKKLDDQLDKERDNVALYRQSLWEHELKLATVHAIPRGSQIVAGEPLLHVTIKDVKEAEKFLKGIGSGMDTVIENLGELEEPLRTQKTAEKRVLRHIRRAGEDGLGFNELGKHFPGVPRDKIHGFVDNLVSQGLVATEFIKDGSKGRPPRVLKAVEYVE